MFRYLLEQVQDDIFQEAFLILWTEIQNRTIYSKDGCVACAFEWQGVKDDL